MRKHFFSQFIVVAAVLTLSLVNFSGVYADDPYIGPMAAFMMSPMTNRISLNPGETYTGSFWIMNPEENTISIKYSLEVKSFYRDDNSRAIFEDIEGRGQIANWITLNVPSSGSILPKESDEVFYTINVPEDAPAGGQYAAITATSVPPDNNDSSAIAVKESIVMAHTIFAEVSGETRLSAEITDLNSPSFLFDGNIVASSKVKNTGNLHGTATYTMEVYPLFSGQPIYSNVNAPVKKLVLPDRTMINEIVYEETPAAGIFNLVYKVEFENGEVKELKKLVIKCPIWVFLIIISVIVGFVIYFVVKAKKRSRRQKELSI